AMASWVSLWTVSNFMPGVRLWGFWERAVAWTVSVLYCASWAAWWWLPEAGVAAGLLGVGGGARRGGYRARVSGFARVYRRSDPLGRRQIKWVVYGGYLAVLPSLAFVAVTSLSVWPQAHGYLFAATVTSAAALPLGILVAIAFYGFFDIDRLFSAT